MEGLSRDEVLYDPRTERSKQIHAQRQRRMRKRRRIRNFILLAVFAGILFYFLSDLSKVRSLSVKGNYFYSDEEIYELANVSYDTRYILKPAFLIENSLKSGSLIEEAIVDKDLSGVIRIEVKEKLVIGYFVKEDEYYLLVCDGSQIKVSDQQISSAKKYPLLSGFNDEQLEALASAFASVEDQIDSDVLLRISEIVLYETSFNTNMMRVIMRDGNTLYGSYESAGVLQIYESVLTKLKGNNVCLYMDEENGAMSKISCSEFADSETKEKEK